MTPKEFQKFLDRDKWCLHCGAVDGLAPNHRANRGHGGSKRAELPSNVVVLCSLFNGLIESDSKAAVMAKRFGWKISRYDNPREMPVFDTQTGEWFFLNDDYTRERLIG